MKKQGLSSGELKGKLDDYKSALADQAFEQQLAAESMGIFGAQAQATGEKLAAQKASADGLRQSIEALNDVNRAALGGMIGFEASIDAAQKAAQKNAGALRMVGGQLDLNSPKAQAAAMALQDLGTKTKDAATSARESGASWERVNGIYARGREQFIASARAMGLSRSEAAQLATEIMNIPSSHKTKIQMQTEDAIAGLSSVISAIKRAPNAKSVTVKALTKDAISTLESLGYKVKRLPNGKFSVTAATGSAMSNIRALQRARDALKSKNITLTTTKLTVFKTVQASGGGNQAAKNYAETFRAFGGPVRGYADGGNVQAIPNGGYVQGPGSGTSDSILAMFGSGAAAAVSNTEYVMQAASVRKYRGAVLRRAERGPSEAGQLREGWLCHEGGARCPQRGSGRPVHHALRDDGGLQEHGDPQRLGEAGVDRPSRVCAEPVALHDHEEHARQPGARSPADARLLRPLPHQERALVGQGQRGSRQGEDETRGPEERGDAALRLRQGWRAVLGEHHQGRERRRPGHRAQHHGRPHRVP
ncbi:hypothetical protein [Streptomyces sp. KL116D]|uniref:hypothetical protein n=1 Tax=Streptomyces sp. KL116D TaxID=3045152 RepID=UPI0035574380